MLAGGLPNDGGGGGGGGGEVRRWLGQRGVGR
jgi:hypothetical protein